MKILHITNWYQSKKEPFKVPFIKEHVEALNLFCQNDLYHLEVQDDGEFFYNTQKGSFSDWEHYRIIKTKKIPWRIKEYLSSKLLLNTFKSLNVNEKYDLINIHTAYPLCAEIDKILSYLKIPLVFTEHWTAFSFNFNLPEKSKSLDRIRKIYQRRVPIITVSDFLGQEIKRFSQNPNLNYFVVPNVVNEEIFNFKNKPVSDNPTFFMVNYWREIKNPFPAFEAFEKLLVDFPNAKLRVGGYGPLWKKMKDFVAEKGLGNHIQLLGGLSKSQIADEMQGITAFLHAARFETFSVVCAEALLCGTPVVVSNLACVAEYLDKDSGILVEKDFYQAMQEIIRNIEKFDRKAIAQKYHSKFSKQAVGGVYFETLNKLHARFFE
jgi:L-malate glycosyltransferase